MAHFNFWILNGPKLQSVIILSPVWWNTSLLLPNLMIYLLYHMSMHCCMMYIFFNTPIQIKFIWASKRGLMALESNMAGCLCEADSHEVTLVELKPEDIPGAVVTDKEIGKLSLNCNCRAIKPRFHAKINFIWIGVLTTCTLTLGGTRWSVSERTC